MRLFATRLSAIASGAPAEPIIPPRWEPDEISLVVWYDADDAATISSSGTQVTQMLDKSGNSYTLTPAGGESAPLTGTRTLNGMNVLEWTGNNCLQNLSFAYNQASTALNVAMVVQIDSPAGTQHFVLAGTSTTAAGTRMSTLWVNNSFQVLGGSGGGNIQFLSGVTSPAGQPYLLLPRYNASNSSWRVNGTQTNTGSVGTNAYSILQIGHNEIEASDLDGFVAEIVAFPVPEMAELVEGYLAHKWGMAGDLPPSHPYKNAAPPPTEPPQFDDESTGLNPRQPDQAAYGNGTFIISANNGNMVRSTNGIDWVTTGRSGKDVLWSGQYHVASTSSSLERSNDGGLTWTSVPLAGYQQHRYGGSDGNGLVVFGQFNNFGTNYHVDLSNDHGATVIRRVTPVPSFGSGVLPNGRILIHDANPTQSRNFGYYSNDNGVTWNTFNFPSSQRWSRMIYANGKIYALTYTGGVVAYSVDGINWQQSTMPLTSCRGIAYGNGFFVAVDNSTQFAYSIDGIKWFPTLIPSPSTESRQGADIAFGGGRFVAPKYYNYPNPVSNRVIYSL